MSRTLADRLWSRTVETEGGCLEFTGYVNPHGYGEIGVGTRAKRAHRVAWEVANGPIPAGMFVLHECDNRACIRPAHLHLGTHQDNMREMKDRGRGRGAEGASSPFAKLTAEQVEDIRRRHVPGTGPGRARGNTAELALEFGITPQYVGQLSRGRWRRSA